MSALGVVPEGLRKGGRHAWELCGSVANQRRAGAGRELSLGTVLPLCRHLGTACPWWQAAGGASAGCRPCPVVSGRPQLSAWPWKPLSLPALSSRSWQCLPCPCPALGLPAALEPGWREAACGQHCPASRGMAPDPGSVLSRGAGTWDPVAGCLGACPPQGQPGSVVLLELTPHLLSSCQGRLCVRLVTTR